MTIAVSSVVRPSKLLFAAVAAMGAATAAALGAAALIRLGVPSFAAFAASATVGGLAALLGGFHLARNKAVWRIDISGTGRIRLASERAPGRSYAFGTVRLLENSTLWPNLLMLRFQSENGRIIELPVLPDSVSVDEFRALSAALRWIALRHADEPGKNL